MKTTDQTTYSKWNLQAQCKPHPFNRTGMSFEIRFGPASRPTNLLAISQPFSALRRSRGNDCKCPEDWLSVQIQWWPHIDFCRNDDIPVMVRRRGDWSSPGFVKLHAWSGLSFRGNPQRGRRIRVMMGGACESKLYPWGISNQCGIHTDDHFP